MKPVMKEIYQDLLDHLKPYGYKMYKGKIWRYNPDIGYVIAIAVDPTRWGTLNEIIVSYSTSQEPIELVDYGSKKIIIPRTCWAICAYLLAYRGGGGFCYGAS